jgi:hypothetical protein
VRRRASHGVGKWLGAAQARRSARENRLSDCAGIASGASRGVAGAGAIDEVTLSIDRAKSR